MRVVEGGLLSWTELSTKRERMVWVEKERVAWESAAMSRM